MFWVIEGAQRGRLRIPGSTGLSAWGGGVEYTHILYVIIVLIRMSSDGQSLFPTLPRVRGGVDGGI